MNKQKLGPNGKTSAKRGRKRSSKLVEAPPTTPVASSATRPDLTAASGALSTPKSPAEIEEIRADMRDAHRLLAVDTVWTFSDVSPLEKAAAQLAAKQLYHDLQPADAIDRGMAIAMVASLNMGLGCIGTAKRVRDKGAVATPFMIYGLKSLDTYADLAQRYDKRRGGGEQKMTVRHVHVNAGGQAIVGDVTNPPPQLSSATSPAPEITLAPIAPEHLTSTRVELSNQRRKT